MRFGLLVLGAALALHAAAEEVRLKEQANSPEGPAVVRSVPCRFVPLLGEEGFSA